ncbi:MAG: RNA polymerase sigma factor [Acidimicrobiales bacterium]
MSTSNYEVTTLAPPGRVPGWLASVMGGTDGLEAEVGSDAGDLNRRRPDHGMIMQAYYEHHRGLLRFAALVAPADCQPEDLVQDAFVRLYRSWHKVSDRNCLGGYLRTTVLNLARGRGRRIGVARRLETQTNADVESAESQAIDRLGNRDVIRALRTLSRRQKECLVLRHYEGYSETEIAATLGISVGSARTHLHRGTTALRQAMGGE